MKKLTLAIFIATILLSCSNNVGKHTVRAKLLQGVYYSESHVVELISVDTMYKVGDTIICETNLFKIIK